MTSIKWFFATAAGLALAAACVSDDGGQDYASGGAGGSAGAGGSGGASAGAGGTSGSGGFICYDASWIAGVSISVFDALTCEPMLAHFVVEGWDGGHVHNNTYRTRAPEGCYPVHISAPGYQSRDVVVRIDGIDESNPCAHGSNNAVKVTLHPVDGGGDPDDDGGSAIANCSDEGDLDCGAPVVPEAGTN